MNADPNRDDKIIQLERELKALGEKLAQTFNDEVHERTWALIKGKRSTLGALLLARDKERRPEFYKRGKHD